MDLAACRAFVCAVNCGTITAAAEQLGVSRPTLSRRLAALEESVGLALLHRTTRAVGPTPAGRRLYDRLQPMLAELEAVGEQLRSERDGIVGRLVVSVPPAIATDVTGLLVALQDRHPGLEVHLLTEVRVADLRTDTVEVALRAGRLDDPDLIQRRLCGRDVRAVASPAYLAEFGRPSTVGELASHDVLMGLHPDGTPRHAWPLLDGGWVEVSGRFHTADQAALLTAALADGGIALLTDVTYGSPVSEGRLECVLPEVVGTRLDLHAVYARRTLQPARIRAFVDAAVDWFG